MVLRVRRMWPLYQAIGDLTLWVTAGFIATLFRHDLRPFRVDWDGLVVFSLAGAALLLVTGGVTGLYRRRWRYGSFEELGGVVAAAVPTGLVMATIDAVAPSRLVPLGVAFAVPMLAVVFMAATRYLGRIILETGQRPLRGDARRLVIYGAGSAGTKLVRSLLRNPDGRYLPVGFIDDDPTKQNLRIAGVRVLGTRQEAVDVLRATDAELVVIAIPSATGETLREIAEVVGGSGVPVNTLPSVDELVSGKVNVSDIRELTEADLLGRRAIDTDVAAIAAYVTGKRVLVTGAGGSIGSELCRQLHRFSPERLVMVDRDESALHAVQLSLDGRARLDSRDVVVADIRDADRVLEVFDEHRPDVVFHAAALKHVPLLELYPGEALKTNVLGTANVLHAARRFEVERFVNVSTDKAADPSNVLGYTKRITERLTAAAARDTGRPFVSVRFGNVIGSRGSVLPAFKAMIDAGGPVTVTDPEVTRFFMTIPEAVQLIIQAGAIGVAETVMILDMGRPVRIADVARRLIESSGKNVPIVYTGLRPGEKLHEVLFDADEVGVPSSHPLIRMATVDPLRIDRTCLAGVPTEEIHRSLRRLALSPLTDGAPLQRTS